MQRLPAYGLALGFPAGHLEQREAGHHVQVGGDPLLTAARAEQGQAHRQRRQRLGFAVPVGMIFIARFDGVLQPEVHDHRSEDISQRLDAVGDQGKRMTEDAACDLGRGEQSVQAHADKGGLAALCGQSL